MNRAMAQEDAPIICADLMSEETCLAPDCVWQDEVCVDAPAPEIPSTPEISDNQIININPVEETDMNWQPSTIQTYAVKFLIRGKEALTWSLNIEDGGFHNPAIQTSYNKVLTIVNSLFILGMLAIAAMWMFSIFIPRRQLRKVVLVYAAAVIFVNFALPVTRLLIDSTNLLQRTMLVQDGNTIEIADIVQTNKTYAETLGYVNKESATENVYEKTEISIPSDTVTESEIGKISDVTLSGASGTDGVTLQQNDPGLIKLDTNKPLTIESRTKFFPESESAIFAFAMVMFTGVAYFILSLIFVFRIIILWALLILSPALILLAIFRATRGWFVNWLAIYGRWLLIGPLTALGIAVIVNIWKMAGGTPIANDYAGETFAENLTNISFVLPGGSENTLSTTGQMMEYIVFLMMLYIPIFFAFALTRQKTLGGAMTAIVEGVRGRQQKAVMTVAPETPKAAAGETAGFIGTLKDMFSGKLAKITQTAMPAELRAPGYKEEHFAPSASNFLPENLALTSTHGMMELLGASKESRHSRDAAIEKLAAPNAILNPKERDNNLAVRREIEKRAAAGDSDASILMNEIRDKQASASAPVTTPTMGPVMAGAGETRTEIRTEGSKVGPLTERVETKTVEKGTVAKTEGKAITPVKAEKKNLEEEKKKEGEEKEKEETEEEKTEAKAEDGSEKKEEEGELNAGEEKNF